MRKYVVPNVPADKAAHTYTVKWADGVDLCPLATGDAFSQTTILGMGFGVDATSPASKIDLLIGNITFVSTPVTATPCTGICTSPAVTLKIGDTLVGAAQICLESTSLSLIGGNCGQLATGRTVSLNGVAETCDWTNFTAPAKVNGGYCLYSPAGTAGGKISLW
jgi:hypothetical protein